MDALSSAVHFRTVGVISRRNSPELKDSVGVVCDVLARHGVTVLLEAATAAMMPTAGFAAVPRDALGAECDLVVVVGGDGSLLGVGRELV
ncbi:MAG: NAD(+) kinase, partial [Gammaproteobacteria bacterium]